MAENSITVDIPFPRLTTLGYRTQALFVSFLMSPSAWPGHSDVAGVRQPVDPDTQVVCGGDGHRQSQQGDHGTMAWLPEMVGSWYGELAM